MPELKVNRTRELMYTGLRSLEYNPEKHRAALLNPERGMTRRKEFAS